MSIKSLPPALRPREKFHALGPAALADAELLAVLLGSGFKGCDVLTLASGLLERFQGLAGLMAAPPAALQAVKGLGGARGAVLGVVFEIARRSLRQELNRQDVFCRPDDVKRYLQMHMASLEHEVFVVLFLDTHNRLLRMEELFRGTLNQTSVYPREVVKRCLSVNAAAVVLAHNHPSGLAEPSKADEHLTATMRSALALIDVRVLDHVIVGAGATVSMAERGLM